MRTGAWPSERLKHVADVAYSSVDKKSVEGEIPVRLCNYTDVYYQDDITSDLPFMESTATADQVRRFGLREGDILITKDSETAEDIGVPAFVTETLADVVCGYHLAILRPRCDRVEPRFLYWSVLGNAAREQMSVSASGVTRFGMRFDDVANLSLQIPELGRQRAIADFLDHETARIASFVSARMRMVELLRDRWSALLTSSVDPPSSSAIRLKRVLSRPLEYGIGEAAEFDDPTWPRYIRTTDVTAEGDLRSDTFKSLPPEVAAPYLLHDGDLLLTRSGATVGKSLLYHGEWGPACFAGYLIRAAADRTKVLPPFLSYFAQSEAYWSQIRLLTLQATIQNVSAERYGDLVVRLPPVQEQQRIVVGLQREARRSRRLRQLLLEQIDRLREHRQALITAAVTGQVDFKPPIRAPRSN